MLTAIGARPSVWTGIAATAVAFACTFTVEMPSTLAKKPSAGRVWLTVIVSFGPHVLLIVIVAPATPAFLLANVVAKVVAPCGSDGSA